MLLETPGAVSESVILSRVIEPTNGTLTAAAARAWLQLDFGPEDRARMHQLALRAQEGTLSDQDEVELDSYRRVGRLLDMMHSKARRSLKKRTRPSA